MQMAKVLRNPSQMSLDVFSSSVQASTDNRLGRLMRITRQQLMFLLADTKETNLVFSSLRRFHKHVKDMISRTKVSKSYKAFLRRLEEIACSGPFPYRSERRYGWKLARALYTYGTTGLPMQLAELLDEAKQLGELATQASTSELAEFFWIGWEGAILRAKLVQSDQPIRAFAKQFFVICKVGL